MGIEIGFDEHGTEFDEPYVVRCVRPFDVFNDLYGEVDDAGERLHVEAGTEWEIFSPSYESGVSLEGTGEVDGWTLDLSWEALDECFELIREGRYYDYD